MIEPQAILDALILASPEQAYVVPSADHKVQLDGHFDLVAVARQLNKASGDAGRKYSVADIDRMRSAISTMLSGYLLSEATNNPGGWSMSTPPLVLVEDYLRTYMLNGTTPEELEAAAAQHTASIRAEVEGILRREPIAS